MLDLPFVSQVFLKYMLGGAKEESLILEVRTELCQCVHKMLIFKVGNRLVIVKVLCIAYCMYCMFFSTP